jgi:flagellar biosynthesis/type III secretory pathway protein FliH
MSRSATVLGTSAEAERPAWLRPGAPATGIRPFLPSLREAGPAANAPAPLVLPSLSLDRAAAAEQEVYDRGFAAGQRAAAESERAEARATLARLSAALGELAAARTEVLRRSEHDVVRLGVAIAERILRREVQGNPAILLSMARAALQTLGEGAVATIELHPDDFEVLLAGQSRGPDDGPVRLSSNPHLKPGSCVVQSATGTIDVGLDAQIKEVLDGLLRDDAAG